MKESLNDKFNKAAALIGAADHIIIGGGAGLSTAAGISYAGRRFESNFADFIAAYGFGDMYSAGFYPFGSLEEKWAYWARHIRSNRYEPPATSIYLNLKRLVANKDFFVITTNVDHQFFKAGFAAAKVFAVQGDYGLFQCSRACHNSVYDNESAVFEMCAKTKDCRIPAALIPRCPRCGREMEVNIRKDEFFVEDVAWQQALCRYNDFITRIGAGSLLIELGVGFNTPGIIRFPFEAIAAKTGCSLIRVNADYGEVPNEIQERALSFDDIGSFIETMLLKVI